MSETIILKYLHKNDHLKWNITESNVYNFSYHVMITLIIVSTMSVLCSVPSFF